MGTRRIIVALLLLLCVNGFAPGTPFLSYRHVSATSPGTSWRGGASIQRLAVTENNDAGEPAATAAVGTTTDRSSLASANEWLDAAVQSTLEKGGFDESSFLVGILGDLHIDPRKMDDYVEGRDHWVPIFERAKEAHGNVALVSLGDLGESKNCGHNPANPSELFAGTTLCHEMAAEFLGSFDVPYEVVGGNHGTCCMYLCCVCVCVCVYIVGTG
jgi:hypothetical protein